LRGATRSGAEPALIVFARAPVPGRVKTRLVPLLGAQGAAQLHARLVRRALQTARRANVAAVELCCAPRPNLPFFLQCARRYGVSLRWQGGGDLGERMLRACRRALRTAPGVILIGSDCPALSAADLRAAARALQAGADAVLSPAEDGGYALIGLRRVARQLFDGVAWGEATVLAQTRARLRRLGWRHRELRTVWDVDRPADVVRLRRSGLLQRAKRG
jgi:rSAM/selenodomain-associated transferase 1